MGISTCFLWLTGGPWAWEVWNARLFGAGIFCCPEENTLSVWVLSPQLLPVLSCQLTLLKKKKKYFLLWTLLCFLHSYVCSHVLLAASLPFLQKHTFSAENTTTSVHQNLSDPGPAFLRNVPFSTGICAEGFKDLMPSFRISGQWISETARVLNTRNTEFFLHVHCTRNTHL